MAAAAAILISDQNGYSFFYLKVTQLFAIKFRVDSLFGSGKKGQNRFSKWRPWSPRTSSETSIGIYDLQDTLIPFTKLIGLSVQDKKLNTDL